MKLATALTFIITGSVAFGALIAHFSWSRASSLATSQLISALELQVTQAVNRAWWEQIVGIQRYSKAVHAAFLSANSEDARAAVFVSSNRFSPIDSWLVHVATNGTILAGGSTEGAGYKLAYIKPDGLIEKIADPQSGVVTVPFAVGFDAQLRGLNSFDWHQFSSGSASERWEIVKSGPTGRGWALAYVQQDSSSVTANLIDHQKFAEILGSIPVVGGGQSYILGPDGAVVITAQGANSQASDVLREIAAIAAKTIAARSNDNKNITENVQVAQAGSNYAVAMSPLWFNGWQLVVVAPEEKFLSEVNRIYKSLPLVVSIFAFIAVIIALSLNFFIFKRSTEAIVANLKHVERFELDRVAHRSSFLWELDRVSDAIARMSIGLASFGKFIPVEQVRSMLAGGSGATLGGTRRPITVFFTDIVGFTALSEHLGEDILPLLSSYLEVTSTEVTRESGTVDKYIGDSVMAFWDAPMAGDDQVLHACIAALAVMSSIEAIKPLPGADNAFKIRIGIDFGTAVVGYVGSTSRLNYTAIGDVVNVANRIESLNKYYDTDILIGESAKIVAGDRLLLREVDWVLVSGRSTAIAVYELLGIRGKDLFPGWAQKYASGLEAYREERFLNAADWLSEVLAERPNDGPARVLQQKCLELLHHPPDAGWKAITTMTSK